MANRLIGQRADRIHHRLVGGEQSDQQNRDRRKECKEIAEKAWVTIELLSHQPHGWSDHEEEGEGEQDKRDRDLKIQDLASLTVDFVASILLP